MQIQLFKILKTYILCIGNDLLEVIQVLLIANNCYSKTNISKTTYYYLKNHTTRCAEYKK